MKKIAILGCENSHADAFISCIKTKEEFSDVEVVGVYSNDREAAQKIFEKFYRVKGASDSGHGIGLTIVKKIVELHNGEVGVESKNDITKFTIILPKK